MRALIIYFFFFFIGSEIFAQNADNSNRNITLKILDRRERPVRGVIVQSLATGNAGITDRSGLFVFNDMADNDTISIKMARDGYIFIPVTGMDSIIVTARSSRLYSYIDNYGQNVNIETSVIERRAGLDVQELLKLKTYNSLMSLIQEEMPEILNRSGPTSLYMDVEPLVVLDGRDIGTLNAANSIVVVHDIKTIEWQSNGSGWGVRGANGVILINYK